MTTKQIQEVIAAGQGLKNLAESYTEIASIKLKRIREDVERNRAFFEELTNVYAHVKQIAAKEHLKVNFKTKDTVSIVLTSNYRFYGNINTRLSQEFYKKIQSYKTDLVIIGKTGQENLQGHISAQNGHYLLFKKDLPSDVELQNLARFIQPYSRILVYYSQFKSVLVQLPVIKDITQNQEVGNQYLNSQNILPDDIGFILEPEISEMLVFFDSQITALLLQEAFLEAELSRTASRLISMDQAQSNATEYIKKQEQLINVSQKLVQNMRILETVNAYAKVSRDRGGKR